MKKQVRVQQKNGKFIVRVYVPTKPGAIKLMKPSGPSVVCDNQKEVDGAVSYLESKLEEESRCDYCGNAGGMCICEWKK